MPSKSCLLLSLLLIFGKEIESSIKESFEVKIIKLEKQNEALEQELNLLRSNDQTSCGLCLGWQNEMGSCIGEYFDRFFVPQKIFIQNLCNRMWLSIVMQKDLIVTPVMLMSNVFASHSILETSVINLEPNS